MTTSGPLVLERGGLDHLIVLLREDGYEVLGPRVESTAIVHGPIKSTEDLPVGIEDRQGPGRYRLEQGTDGALLGYAAPQASWKAVIHPPEAIVWAGDRTGAAAPQHASPKQALFAVRPCDMRALEILDLVFLHPDDEIYRERRKSLFIVAVNCTSPGGTCFCASMGSGPGAPAGFDIALTEVFEGEVIWYLAEAGSNAGDEVLGRLDGEVAGPSRLSSARSSVEQATELMGRQLETPGIKELLYANATNPRWEETARRCLTCSNCTMVCPTCFCATVEDRQSLDGSYAERVRRWDSCFTLEFSYVHGGSTRTSSAARYRQWLTHKLGSWQDQFGLIGCVGCGRCITWCPVGIDITEEVAAISAADLRNAEVPLPVPEVTP